jgi:autotransporter-associated beta strand protein
VTAIRNSRWERILLKLAAFMLVSGSGMLHAQQDLESSVPANWAAGSGSLSISGDHSKMGAQSLRWNWTGGDFITVSSPGIVAADVTNFYKHTCDLWVWNGSALPGGKLRVEFRNGSTAQYWFDFNLDYTGWRRAVRSYAYDMAKKTSPSSTFTSVRISAPASGSGSFYLDAVSWVGDRFTRIRDGQNPDIAGSYSSSRAFDALANVPDIAATVPTVLELSELATLRSRWLAAIKGSTTPGAASVTSASASFDALNIVDGAAGIRGNPLGPQTPLESWPLTLARDHAFGTSATAPASRNRMQLLARHLLDQGMADQSGDEFWGGVGDYDFRNLPNSLILMASALEPATKVQLWEFARWHYRMGNFWSTDWERNTDEMYYGIFQWLGAILFLAPDDTEAVRLLKGFKRHVERFVITSEGSEDGIKPDGLGFHHRSHYNNYMYAFPVMSDTLYHLRDTGFQVDVAAYGQLRSAFLTMMRMSADGAGTTVGYFGNSLCGRKAFDNNLTFSRDNLRRLGEWGGRLMGQTADPVVAQAYNRRFGVNDYALFTPYGAEPAPDGFHQFNYSPLGIYRRAGWVASIRAPQRYFWSSEIYPTANRYGRYQSYGSLEVLYHGGLAMSGRQLSGWDWNHTPGATTIVLPDDQLVAEYDRQDVRSQINYSGALSFHDGQSGMYACNFQEKNVGPNHNPSFVWRKSWFCFGNQIVCLGSNIANNDAANPTATTLFQGKLATRATAITLDGNPVTGFPHSSTTTGAHWMLDAFGTGYYVYPGSDLKITRSTQSSANEAGSGLPTTADFSKAWLDHGSAPAGAAYEYAVFPGTNATAMGAMAVEHADTATKPYAVVQRDSGAHVVKWRADGKIGYAIYTTSALPPATRSAGLLVSVERPCLVMTQLGGNQDAWISVVDPDLNFSNPEAGYGIVDASVARTLEFTVNGVWTLDAPAAGVSVVTSTATTTTLRVTTQHGFPVAVHLLNAAAPRGIWANVGPDWNDPVNWGGNWGGGLPLNDLSSDIAVFGAASEQPVLGSAYSVKGLTLAGGTTLSGAGMITLGTAGVVATGTNHISLAGLALGVSQSWDIGSGGMNVSASISGGSTASITKTGPGTLTLSGNNSYTGGTAVGSASVNGGIVNVSGDQSAANGGWTFNGLSTVNFQSGSTIAVGVRKNITFGNSGSAGVHTLNVAGTVTTSSSSELVVRGRSTLNLESGADWTQSGTLTLQPLNTSYEATMNVKSGSSFTYNGSSDIILARSASGNSGNATLNLSGGTFTTFRGFSNSNAGTGSGSTNLNFSAGGTLKLSADIASLIIRHATTPAPFNVTIGTGGGVIDTNGFSAGISAGITGSSLTKIGAGTLTLAGSNIYSGATTINGGTLAVTGSLGGTAVEVKDAATLAVGGSLGGPVTVRAGGRLAFSIAATPAAQVVRSIAGNLILDSGNVIDLTAAAPPAAGDYLLAGASGISGVPGLVNLPAGISGMVTTVGGNLRLTISPAPYAAWVNGYQVGGMTAIDDDFDRDGLPNGIEFVVGGDPSVSSSARPSISLNSAGSVVFTFSRNDAAKAMELSCETSEDCVSWPLAASYQIQGDTASSTPGVVITNDADANPDTVTVTIPVNNRNALFVRLKVSE